MLQYKQLIIRKLISNTNNLPDHKFCSGMVFHLYVSAYEFQDDVETWKHMDTTHIYNIFHLRVIYNAPITDI